MFAFKVFCFFNDRWVFFPENKVQFRKGETDQLYKISVKVERKAEERTAQMYFPSFLTFIFKLTGKVKANFMTPVSK